MEKATLISAVKHDSKDYKPGDTFEGDKKIVNELIRAGAAQDPSTVFEQTSAIEIAEGEAKTIVAEAQKEADKIKSDAEGEAKTIIGKAEEAAGLKIKEAEKALADAKTEAEKLVKNAQDAAKKAPDTKTNTPAK